MFYGKSNYIESQYRVHLKPNVVTIVSEDASLTFSYDRCARGCQL